MRNIHTKITGFTFFLIVLLFPFVLYAWEAKVLEVLDGDTIVVLKNGKQIVVRLASIDCPEIGQPHNIAARKFTDKWVAGKSVTVWPTDTDQEGRTVAFVFIGKTDLNKELLKAGLAWHHKAHARDPEFAKLEFDAKAKKVGLWAEPNPVPPWEWGKK